MEGRGRTKQEPESRATQGAVIENSYLATDVALGGSMEQLLGDSMT